METSARLARLIVEALELDTPKREWDVVDELFAVFGQAAPTRGTAAAEQFLEESAARLAAAVDRPANLLNAFLRIGGRFLGMLDEVYAFLAQHLATTSGTNETLRVRRDETDEDTITISPAFLEQVRTWERRIAALQVGRIDHVAVQRFTNADNGEFYGRWPPDDRDDGMPLLDGILHLAWLRDDPPVPVDVDLLARASEAAGRVVLAAEALVQGYMGSLDALDGRPEPPGPDDVESRVRDRVLEGLSRYREHGFFGTPVYPGAVTGADVRFLVGLDSALRSVEVDDEGYGDPVGNLAGFVALARAGRWSPRLAERLRDQWISQHDLDEWLEALTAAADEAALWLMDGAVIPDGTVSAEVLVQVVEEFLRLPLWRQRDLLYEVWVLVLTITAAGGGGWSPTLLGMSGDVWTLGRHGSTQPVARLDGASGTLEVWREPRRQVAAGVLTPDVTVATTGELARDLVVVEAKDRIGISSGTVPSPGRRRTANALAVARRYATALHPSLTWVVNHCDLDDEIDAGKNLGDPWTKVYVGSGVRPGSVPGAFAVTILEALAVSDAVEEPAADEQRQWASVVLLVDATRSMADHPVPWSALEGASEGRWRAVVFRDHDGGNDGIVATLGPYARPADLVAQARSVRSTGGTGPTAAIEDALRTVREIAVAEGPQTVLVITDAVPNDPCPHGVDYRAEIDALLAGGSRLLVATDWINLEDEPWSTFEGRSGWTAAPLGDLVERVTGQPAGRA